MIPQELTGTERVKYILAHKAEIIDLKKSATKHTDVVITSPLAARLYAPVEKRRHKQDTEDAIERTIIGNTYNWIDSQDDVLVAGVFSKSIQESKGSIFHLHDHLFQTTAKVGKPIQIYEREIAWRDLGLMKDGKTTSLFMDSEILRNYNSLVFEQYKTGEINQHSVGMQYVKLFLAANEPDDKDAFAAWQRYSPLIGNPAKLEQGYFFVCTEAKLREISAVLLGANELTGVINPHAKSDNGDEIEELLKNVKTEKDFDDLCKSLRLKTLLTTEPPHSTHEEEAAKAAAEKKKLFYTNLLK